MSVDEKKELTKQIVDIADKISAKDTENKEWISKMVTKGVSALALLAVIGGGILGLSVKSRNIPENSDENDDAADKKEKK